VVPLFGTAEGATRPVVGAYARKLLDNLRAGTPKHLYLPVRIAVCSIAKALRVNPKSSVRGADRCAHVLGGGVSQRHELLRRQRMTDGLLGR